MLTKNILLLATKELLDGRIYKPQQKLQRPEINLTESSPKAAPIFPFKPFKGGHFWFKYPKCFTVSMQDSLPGLS